MIHNSLKHSPTPVTTALPLPWAGSHSAMVLCRDKMKLVLRVVTGLLVFWLLVLLYMNASLYSSSDINDRTERQLAKALQELDQLKQQNTELHRLALELKDLHTALASGTRTQGSIRQKLQEADQQLQRLSQPPHPQQPQQQQRQQQQQQHGDLLPSGGSAAPGLAHEELRRRLYNGVMELFYYLRAQLDQLRKDGEQGVVAVNQRVDAILNNGNDMKRMLMSDLYNMSQVGGAGAWRQKETQELEELVQRRLRYLQNPKDCGSAKKLVCNMNKGCGYGCQLHHTAYCFIMAYGLGRTFVLDSRGWRYSPSGWEKYFQPLSQTCQNKGGLAARSWGGGNMDNVQVVELPIIDSLHPRPPFLPQAIPADLAPRIQRLHGHPFAWWVGQILKYLVRPSEEFGRDIEQTMKELGFQSPIVGVHVRRTDKVGTEAAFHSIDEYMSFVEEYYTQRERQGPVDQRRVYLATDDPNVLDEAKRKFPDYTFISDNSFSKSAGLTSRYSDLSLRAIILDIHFLSLTDYLVCTFSSQVCRVAYELMQTRFPDASTFFHSLDDVYYFGGQNAHNQQAVWPHHAQDHTEIDLAPGDHVGIAGNHWNGYSKGVNRRTGKSGLYPSYKVAEVVNVAKMPVYREADDDPERRVDPEWAFMSPPDAAAPSLNTDIPGPGQLKKNTNARDGKSRVTRPPRTPRHIPDGILAA